MRSSVFASAAVFSVALSANAEDRSTIYDGLLAGDSAGELSTFVDLMNQTFSQEDLDRIFGGEAVFTIFAPTNAAFEELFAALSDEENANLQDQNSGAMESLLRYHMTQGRWHRQTGALRMLDDSVAQTYREDGELNIDEATVEDQTRYRNGLVATINTVISPRDAPLPVGCGIVTSHENDLFFVSATSVSGTFGAHSVTHCQPYGSVFFQKPDKLAINAGRKNSAPPAQWFLEQSGLDNTPATGAVWSTKTYGGSSTPADLHFAQLVTEFKITVSGKEFSCPNVVFGQGSYDSGSVHNNWWVGQVGAVIDSDLSAMILNCTVSNGSSSRLTIGGPQTTADDKFGMAVID